MSGSDVVALLAKAPVPGMVKTRLAATVGSETAAELARAMLLDLVSEHRGQEYDLLIACNLGYPEMSSTVPGITIIQSAGDELRGPNSVLLEVFTNLLGSYRRVIALSADAPFTTPALIRDAFIMLNDVDLVVGPGISGGYYLIGMRRFIDVFSDHRPGRYPYLGQTLARAEAMGVEYRLLSPKWDIDTVDDIRSATWAGSEQRLRHTMSVLQKMGFHN